MRSGRFATAVAVFGVCVCSVCPAQQPTNIAGVPFTAFVTGTNTTPARTTTSSGVIARRSDGSVYYSVNATSSTNPNDRLDRKSAWFNNIAAHQNYTLQLDLHMYEVFPNNLKPSSHPAETAAEYLQRQGGEGYERTVGDMKMKVLGLRKIEGFDTVGILQVKSDGITSERWYSPELDMALETKVHDPQAGDRVTTIGQIRLGEPEGALFEIPAGFTLAPPPINRSRPVDDAK